MFSMTVDGNEVNVMDLHRTSNGEHHADVEKGDMQMMMYLIRLTGRRQTRHRHGKKTEA